MCGVRHTSTALNFPNLVIICSPPLTCTFQASSSVAYKAQHLLGEHYAQLLPLITLIVNLDNSTQL